MAKHHAFTRRDFLKTSMTASALTMGIPHIAKAANKSDRPNILFFMADQYRGDCLSSAGHSAVKTPNLDRIAEEGVRFSAAYSCTPTCTPARAALLTGLGPWRNGMLGYGPVPEKYPIEMPRTLRENGYYTFGLGKMHFHPQRNGHGFNELVLDESSRAETPEFRSDYRGWFASEAPTLDPTSTGIGWNDCTAKPYALPERLHPTAWMGETATRFLNDYNRPEPFFMKVSFARPHSPYDPPERFWKQYEGAPIPKAAVGEWAKKYAPRSGEKDDIWHGDLGPEMVRRARQGYYGSISFVDEQIGRILETLEKRGWLDNTLILFTADHGDMTGDQNLWRKSYAYEPSARIPMLMRWPEGMVPAKRGQICDRPVELRDVLPTFMEAAGAPGAETLDGKSMLALTRDPKADWRPFIDMEHDICYDPSVHWSALTDGKRKYIFHAQKGDVQFFDLEKDPQELVDLSGDSSRTKEIRMWREWLVKHLEERGESFVKDGKLPARPESTLFSPNCTGCSCHQKGQKGPKGKKE